MECAIPWDGYTLFQIIATVQQGKRLESSSGSGVDAPYVSLINKCFEGTSVRPSFDEIDPFLSVILSECELRKSEIQSFLCPIGMEVMRDPVLCCDGFTYERAGIELWMRNHDRSPMTNEILSDKMLFPNTTLKVAIAEWLQQAAMK